MTTSIDPPTHSKLVELATWHVYGMGCPVVASEISIGGCGKPDVIGLKYQRYGPPTREDAYIFECKVTRADFLGDKKLAKYERYATFAYICTPKGLIDREELPDGWGLVEYGWHDVWPAKVTTKAWLRITKRARRRDLEDGLFDRAMRCIASSHTGAIQYRGLKPRPPRVDW